MSSSVRMKLGLSTLCVLIFASAAIAVFSRWSDPAPMKERNIAATLKMNRIMGKHLAPISVQLVQPDSIPDYDHQEVKIKGYITLNHEMDAELNYQWELPEGTQLVSGDLSGSLPHIQKGQTAEIEIHVTGFSKESLKHIILYSRANGPEPIGHSALISSRPEDSWEYVAPQMREYVEATRPEEFRRGHIVK